MADFSNEDRDHSSHPANKNYRMAVAHEEMNSRRRNTMEDVHR